jgi:hypothetical protein
MNAFYISLLTMKLPIAFGTVWQSAGQFRAQLFLLWQTAELEGGV